MKKNKLAIILKIALAVIIIILIGVVGYDLYQAYKTQKNVEDILQQLNEQIEINIKSSKEIESTNTPNNEVTNNEQVNTNKAVINNYIVYGKIEIPSVKIKYPILEYNKETLKNNICSLINKPIDGTGNLCLAGHNSSNGTLFGKLKKVKNGDIVKITNVNGEVYEYSVNNITIVQPEDNSLLHTSDDSIVTLLTCTNNGRQRLVVQAKLIEK